MGHLVEDPCATSPLLLRHRRSHRLDERGRARPASLRHRAEHDGVRRSRPIRAFERPAPRVGGSPQPAMRTCVACWSNGPGAIGTTRRSARRFASAAAPADVTARAWTAQHGSIAARTDHANMTTTGLIIRLINGPAPPAAGVRLRPTAIYRGRGRGEVLRRRGTVV